MNVSGVEMTARGIEPSDKPFIATTWGRSYKERAACSAKVYEVEQRKLIDRLFARGRFAILASRDVPRTIFGWACADLLTLHYVYVVPELRERGIARELLEMLGVWGDTVECSHRFSRQNTRFVWNPYTIGVCP